MPDGPKVVIVDDCVLARKCLRGINSELAIQFWFQNVGSYIAS